MNKPLAQPLTGPDAELIETARDIIRHRFKEGSHHIGSALRTRSGQVFVGVHLEAYGGRIAVCGEAIALGAAATAGDTEIDTIVAVSETGAIVAPCGMCRELISDYSPQASVLMLKSGSIVKVPVCELLPDKYQRN